MLFEYIMNLAKYDLNYDIRDKVRCYKNYINISEQFADFSFEKIVFNEKPIPVKHSHYKGIIWFQCGTFSMTFRLVFFPKSRVLN